MNNRTTNSHGEFYDSDICILKVGLPTKEQLNNGDVDFLNEDIRILEQPDLFVNPDNEIPSSSSSLSQGSATNMNSNRRAAIGDKV